MWVAREYLEACMHALRGACAVYEVTGTARRLTLMSKSTREGEDGSKEETAVREQRRGGASTTEGRGAKSTALQQRDEMDCAIRQGAGGCVLRACMHSAKTTSVEGAEHASPTHSTDCPHPPSNCPPFLTFSHQSAHEHTDPFRFLFPVFPTRSTHQLSRYGTSAACRWIRRGERKAGLTVRRLCRRSNTSHSKRSACKSRSAPQTNNNLPVQSKRSAPPTAAFDSPAG
jgi:hypothetical protein